MAADGDMNAHVATYGSVTKMLFWGSIACGIIAIAVILLIAR